MHLYSCVLKQVESSGSSGGSWREKSVPVTSRPPSREKQSSAMDSSDRFWIFGGALGFGVRGSGIRVGSELEFRSCFQTVPSLCNSTGI